ncbi:MAG: hypothetical protein COV29_02405 [Candidatus Yanofskybacteria bacterium CG10_big_fil_rev_8_21_14_0_10_36_16]|uniref:VTT domain-containing protein n=1 Tax=Candidatus Yanofskybacteria bacterium CG10_big_fil_rev_8_21_14_0_10_36_16 TaxID=1975096 RepID=A0A2J0Q7P5_9BACT|nr:MAG: hypothetical protein COV29_02405 [Candidatus Yanofskybacteria bacterium CG10_big_fil_rev_8_21_14_0_10_36_16]
MHKKSIFVIIFVGVLLALSFWLSELLAENDVVKELVFGYGYAGMFLISIISGFNIVIPVPAITFLPVFTGAGLGFWSSIIIITAGMTIGDGLGYIIGRTGNRLARDKNKIKRYIKEIMNTKKKYNLGVVTLLFIYAAFIPAPNEVIIIPLGFMGYRFKHIFPVVLAGNLVFNTLSAFGVTNLFKII